MKAVILYNAVEADSSSADEVDVLRQLDAVTAALQSLGYQTEALPLSLNLSTAARKLRQIQPAFVFNLVETVDGTGRMIYFAPALLDHLQIPYSGSGSEAMFLTTNKILAKERMLAASLPTPEWLFDDPDIKKSTLNPDTPFIVKPVWEDASVGIEGQAAITSKSEVSAILKERNISAETCFAERYIHGREFNLSVLAGQSGPAVLPAAEIEFVDYPPDLPRIVDYKAKWDSESFEHEHTVRRLDFLAVDTPLINQMRAIALQCWHLFNLHGYARVDFRIDTENRPWILEINANPCIAPDSGFVAACEKAGLAFDKVIERIIRDIPHL
jgi:D-alanine-D-alanine ligase